MVTRFPRSLLNLTWKRIPYETGLQDVTQEGGYVSGLTAAM